MVFLADERGRVTNSHTKAPDEELDDLGVPTGVEDEKSLDERIAEPFDPEDIDVQTRVMTVNLVLSRLNSKAMDLAPDFQRKMGIWNDARRSRLIESLLLRIPLPSFYVAEEKDETWEVVDGIQRLSTIARFVSPHLVQGQLFALSDLEYLSTFEGLKYSSLPGELQRRIQETELVFHVIRFGTPDEVKFNIFARINTGGMPLSYQELRHAMIPGQARSILATLAASNAFIQATDHSVRPDRMADREMVLRFLAFRMRPYSDYSANDLNQFLLDAMKSINTLSSSQLVEHETAFENAMRAATQIFGNDAFRKRFSKNQGRSPVNKALFEVIAVSLAALDQDAIATLVARRQDVQECNLHTLVRLPNGVFNPYTGIKTNLLFFTKGRSSEHVWYYEHPYPEGVKSYNKTRPMRFEEFETETSWWGSEADGFERASRPNRPGKCRLPTLLRATTTSTSKTPTSANKSATTRTNCCRNTSNSKTPSPACATSSRTSCTRHSSGAGNSHARGHYQQARPLDLGAADQLDHWPVR